MHVFWFPTVLYALFVLAGRLSTKSSTYSRYSPPMWRKTKEGNYEYESAREGEVDTVEATTLSNIFFTLAIVPFLLGIWMAFASGNLSFGDRLSGLIVHLVVAFVMFL